MQTQIGKNVRYFSVTRGVSLLADTPPRDSRTPNAGQGGVGWGGNMRGHEGVELPLPVACMRTRAWEIHPPEWHKFSDTMGDQCFWGARAQGRRDYLDLLPVKMALPLLDIHLEACFVSKPVHQHR